MGSKEVSLDSKITGTKSDAERNREEIILVTDICSWNSAFKITTHFNRGADKSLAQPARKQATATKL